MAITRTQIAKQLLAQGGRIGLRGGGADMGTVADSQGNRNEELADRADREQRGTDRLNQQISLRNEVRRQEKEKLEERLEKFRQLNSRSRKFSNFATKVSPIAMIASKFSPLNTRDFLTYNVLDAGRFKYDGNVLTREKFANLSEEEKENVLDSYVSQRNMGEIDAYGNLIGNRGSNGINQIIPIDTTFAQAPSDMDQETEEPQGLGGLRLAFRAEGGPIGGEYDFESARQMYGLGKLVKKVTKTIGKIAKSPIGKAAILGAGTYFGLGKFKAFENLSTLQRLGIAGIAAGLPFLSQEEEDEDEEVYRGEGLNIPAIRANPNQFLARRFVAEGGSMKEPVAKKTMPLLDMDGKEMDLRAEGGFVPIGRMEKADDVPARLSKNEFVFTADAVRNAGEGDVDKGAEVMYNMMKNLESGGEVSKESQGLEGARRMFQTSQRLEEVL